MSWLRGLPIKIDHEMASLAFSKLSERVSVHRLSVYDATYLELAERRALALACKDGSLRKAPQQRGIRLRR
jgi:predicted nucleic acid-binding protein